MPFGMPLSSNMVVIIKLQFKHSYDSLRTYVALQLAKSIASKSKRRWVIRMESQFCTRKQIKNIVMKIFCFYVHLLLAISKKGTRRLKKSS